MKRTLLVLAIVSCAHSAPPPPVVAGPTCLDLLARASATPPHDDLFQAGDWKALVSVQPLPDSDPDALRLKLRIAWAHWQLGVPPGIERFYSAQHPAPSAEALRIERECMVRIFASEPSIAPRAAFAWFTAASGQRFAHELVQRLAERYDRVGRADDATTARTLAP